MAFRANNFSDLGIIYRSIFSLNDRYSDVGHLLGPHDTIYLLCMLMLVVVLFLKELNEEFAVVNRFPRAYRLTKPAVYISMVIAILILGNFSANAFIYFQF
jgi:hypothetical protein